MISIVYNDVVKAIEIMMDTKGAALLIQTLQALQKFDHLHLYATNDDQGLSVISPYQEETVYTELILDLLPADAWHDQPGTELDP